MSRPSRGSIHPLTIERIDGLGRGLGTIGGYPIALRGGVPGSTVEVKIGKRHRGAIRGLFEGVLDPGPHTREPRCPHVGTCGGCSFQTYAYRAQLRSLHTNLAEALEGVSGGTQGGGSGGASVPGNLLGDVEVEPVLGMDDPFAYRNKMDFTFGTRRWIESHEEQGVSSDFALGLHVPGVYSKVLDIRSCAIHFDGADELLSAARELASEHGLSAWDIHRHEGLLRHLVLRKGIHTGEVMVYLVTSAAAPEHIGAWARDLVKRCPQITTIVQGIHSGAAAIAVGEEERVLYGPGVIHEKLCGLTFTLSPTSFFQTNTLQAGRLLECIHEQAKPNTGRILDLYCGAGTIGLTLAGQGRELIGMESVPSAVRNAHSNARLNGIDSAQFIEGDVLESLSRHVQQSPDATPHVDLCVVDPPRAGLHPRVIPALCQAAPERILYVSCNPTTAIRDLGFLATGGYSLTRVQPVDLFPHTPHLECLFTLMPR